MIWQFALLFAGLEMEVPATPRLLDPHRVIKFPVLPLLIGVLSPQSFIRPNRLDPAVEVITRDIYHQ